MAMFKPIETIQSNLELIPVTSGQIIYCTDSRETFMDNNQGERIRMGDIITLATESNREEIFVPLLDKIYLVLESNKLYRFDGEQWVCISNNTKISLIKNSVTITEPTQKINIGIPKFDKNRDTIMVYINSVYLDEGSDYTIDSTSENLLPVGIDNWEGSVKEPSVFNFIVFKNIPLYDDSSEAGNYNKKLENDMMEIKKENALLIFTMACNGMNISNILTLSKLKYFYKHGLWTKNMFDKIIELGIMTREQYSDLEV